MGSLAAECGDAADSSTACTASSFACLAAYAAVGLGGIPVLTGPVAWRAGVARCLGGVGGSHRGRWQQDAEGGGDSGQDLPGAET